MWSLSIFPVQKHMSSFIFFVWLLEHVFPGRQSAKLGSRMFQVVKTVYESPPQQKRQNKLPCFLFKKNWPWQEIEIYYGILLVLLLLLSNIHKGCSNEASPCLGTTEQLFRDPHHPFAEGGCDLPLSTEYWSSTHRARCPRGNMTFGLVVVFLALKASPVKTVGAPTYSSHKIEQQQAWADGGDVSNICSLVILLKIIFRISLAETAIAGDADKKLISSQPTSILPSNVFWPPYPRMIPSMSRYPTEWIW